MDGETAFRSAVVNEPISAHPDTASPISEQAYPPDEMPPSLYQEANKVPLVLDLIGGTSAYEHFDMKPLTKEIDGYISEEITRKGFSDTKEDYQKVLNEALDSLDMPVGTDVYAMVEKIVRHFRIQHKLYSALKEKQELMAADPSTLSAPKLKKYLEMNHGF